MDRFLVLWWQVGQYVEPGVSQLCWWLLVVGVIGPLVSYVTLVKGRYLVSAIRVLVNHLAIKEEKSAEGLVLCRSGDVLLDGQVGEKGFDLGSDHFGRVARAREVEVAFDPADVGLLGTMGVVFEADGIPSASSPRLRSGQAGQART